MSMIDDIMAYHGRGWCIIPFKPGTKEAACKWKQYQTKRPDERELRGWFNNGKHIPAVVLGEVSGGLACRDFDELSAYDEWTAAWPDLADTLPTVETSRGRHVYFRTDKPVYLDLGHAGELRGDSKHCCLIPPAIHPSGKPYKWLVGLPDELPVIDPYLSGLAGPTQPPAPTLQKTPEENGSKQKVNGSCRGRGVVLTADNARAVEAATEATIPTRQGQRNKTLFEFARRLKGIPALADEAAEALKSLVREWHRRALPHIGTIAFETTWIGFLKGWANVKWPANGDFMPQILERAKANPVGNYEEQGISVLAAICRELHLIREDGVFYLSNRKAGDMLGVSHVTANGWLFLLEHDGIIKTIAKGGTKANPYKATRFQYLGPTE